MFASIILLLTMQKLLFDSSVEHWAASLDGRSMAHLSSELLARPPVPCHGLFQVSVSSM